MKTTKITAALLLVLILLGINLVNAGNVGSKNRVINGVSVVRYQVNVHLPVEMKLCNLWVIQIADGNGNLVTPAQGYSTSNNSYMFYEKGPVTGTRVARLVISNSTLHFNCNPEFDVYPDSRTGTFTIGQTVIFDLYPGNTTPPKP